MFAVQSLSVLPPLPPPRAARPEFLDPDQPGEYPLAPASAPEDPRPASSQERARALHRKGRLLQDHDRTGEAIRCLEQSVQLDPGSESAYGVWLLLGQLRMTNPA